jgi:hypothetical protein
VLTPTSGTATTQKTEGISGSGTTCSPRPNPKTDPPSKNSGTSDPTSPANCNRSAPGSATPNSRSNPIKAAAAFADPAPIPPCTGNRFSIWIATSAATPIRASAFSTIFQQVFRPSNGTRPSFEVSEIFVALARTADTVTRSCSSSVWYRVVNP